MAAVPDFLHVTPLRLLSQRPTERQIRRYEISRWPTHLTDTIMIICNFPSSMRCLVRQVLRGPAGAFTAGGIGVRHFSGAWGLGSASLLKRKELAVLDIWQGSCFHRRVSLAEECS